MSIHNKALISIIAASIVGLSVVGCQKKEEPAEQAGAKINQTMNQAKESAEHAADKLTSHDKPAQQVGQKIDQTAEKAGEKIDEATGKAGEKMKEAGEVIQQKAHQ